jgi:plastocyanin
MKDLKAILIATILAAALVFPMTVFAQPDAVLYFGIPGANVVSVSPTLIDANEVTIAKGGTVRFVAGGNNANHRFAMYPVHKSTIDEDIVDSFADNCNGNDCLVYDAQGKLIIDTSVVVGNIFDYRPGRLLWVTGNITVVDGIDTVIDGIAIGTTFEYTFEKTGVYLVICANRGHMRTMFGFVNVIGGPQ